jgi:hypothetical protein
MLFVFFFLVSVFTFQARVDRKGKKKGKKKIREGHTKKNETGMS